MRLDVAALADQSPAARARMAAPSARIFELAGETFNINSPKQLGDVLFEKLKLPSRKRTGKTRTASTAVEVLEELAQAHELPRLMLEWRGDAEAQGHLRRRAARAGEPGHRPRAHLLQPGGRGTGRLSSSDPNLQNIPVRTELGREIRRAFVADPAHVLLSADYSQIELRVLAHLSGDEALEEAFNRGEDIHDQNRWPRCSGRRADWTATSCGSGRRRSTTPLLYGKTAFTLARDIGVTQQAAQAFIDAYFARFPWGALLRSSEQTIALARGTPA